MWDAEGSAEAIREIVIQQRISQQQAAFIRANHQETKTIVGSIGHCITAQTNPFLCLTRGGRYQKNLDT